ncbi:hypothetical protein [Candidatus Methanocrinis natronophilus]|uniref:Uncharacterized protein n=1 Tax=Candidatus Methanocrinis natronophilus TaxID=3033396 RepID=A0ABT5X886_9EURY|nr:hypothetical protein [Candidatus Methanocrinis natronophilus]MDF0590914.1 hypothetical protein [Candidatus Methanocrinis natronophilus]
MASERRGDGGAEKGRLDKKGGGAGYWKRFLFGVAVMAAVFSGLLFALNQMDLIPGGGDGSGLEPPRIDLFEASPAALEPGEGSTLAWRVSGVSLADRVAIEPGIGPVAREGRVAVLPEETTVYILTAINAAGEAEARVTVIVADG